MQSKLIELTHSLELPPDGYSDEITLQVVSCFSCHFRGVAVYEESRHGSLDSESWQHNGYQVSAEALESLVNAIGLCPSPRNTRCECPTHTSIRKMNKHYGRYGLNAANIGNHFEMRLVADKQDRVSHSEALLQHRAWKLQGYDAFAGDYYPLDGDFNTEADAITAARSCLTEIEREQPSASSGGQDGIQDRVFVVRPDGTMVRVRD